MTDIDPEDFVAGFVEHAEKNPNYDPVKTAQYNREYYQRNKDKWKRRIEPGRPNLGRPVTRTGEFGRDGNEGRANIKDKDLSKQGETRKKVQRVENKVSNLKEKLDKAGNSPRALGLKARLKRAASKVEDVARRAGDIKVYSATTKVDLTRGKVYLDGTKTTTLDRGLKNKPYSGPRKKES